MTTDTLTDETVDELENYKGKWKNLHFAKCGRSQFGKVSYDSEAAALDYIVCLLAGNTYWYLSSATGQKIHHKDYSHTIQIPHKGE